VVHHLWSAEDFNGRRCVTFITAVSGKSNHFLSRTGAYLCVKYGEDCS